MARGRGYKPIFVALDLRRRVSDSPPPAAPGVLLRRALRCRDRKVGLVEGAPLGVGDRVRVGDGLDAPLSEAARGEEEVVRRAISEGKVRGSVKHFTHTMFFKSKGEMRLPKVTPCARSCRRRSRCEMCEGGSESVS